MEVEYVESQEKKKRVEEMSSKGEELVSVRSHSHTMIVLLSMIFQSDPERREEEVELDRKEGG